MAIAAVGGGTVSNVTALGIVLACLSSVWYSGYLLAGDRIVSRLDALNLSTLIATGGAIGFLVGSAAVGQLRFEFEPQAWLWFVCSAVVATVVSVTALMAGMRRVGPSLTGVLTTFEPVATILYAFVIFGERFTLLQWAGALAVLAAVVYVQLPERKLAASMPA
jgi:drug/metabolite transporter (DMT)-like permease